MASRTASGDASVVHGCTSEGNCRCMAGLASSTGWYVVAGLGQACTTDQVASRTTSSDASMVHRHTTLK